MVMCSAFNCNTRPGQGLAMFHYPKDPRLRKLWIEKLKRKNFSPSNHGKLCEKHFVETDFVVSREFAKSIGFDQKKLRLKDDAVPSIFALPEQQKKTPCH
ncbi:hypothetical protein FSP39_008328 [Pinctada imbricata]|uniref:THAP-type domain-containing protein n=1 Tax=Pinctada imbricata TaxID=66713 RepID=A0AA88YT58_PINIB|nr:hypothetical protein FSP39_008328 [Pinctada imbricata]